MSNRSRIHNLSILPLNYCVSGLLIAIVIFMIHNWFYYKSVFQLFHQYHQSDRINSVDDNNKIISFTDLFQKSRQLGLLKNGFNLTYVEENLNTLDQKDHHLIQYARARYLTPPSKLPYNVNVSIDLFSVWVADFFKFKRNGIFIEAGANEGEIGSHTLYLETYLGWSGLLVECNPGVVPYLKSHHRKAWVASACLSPTSTPGVMNFSNPTTWSYSGTLNKPWDIPTMENATWKSFEVETVPLYTLLASLGWKEIDYFSFDIEGSELAALKSFPFDEIIFKVLIIEIYFYSEKEKEELDALLLTNNYCIVQTLPHDKIYVHNSVKDLLH